MPIGPNGEVRPSSPIALAVQVCRIATGEEEDVRVPVTGTSAKEDQPKSGRKSGSGRKKK